MKHLSDLASVIKDGYYHCLRSPQAVIVEHLRGENGENLRILAKDMFQNCKRYASLFTDFILGNKSTNIAFFLNTRFLEIFARTFLSQKTVFFLKKKSACNDGQQIFPLRRFPMLPLCSQLIQNSISMTSVYCKSNA